MIYVKK